MPPNLDNKCIERNFHLSEKKTIKMTESKTEIKEDSTEINDDEELDLTSIREIESSGDPKRDKVCLYPEFQSLPYRRSERCCSKPYVLVDMKRSGSPHTLQQ
jgi:hypothetical protein